MDYIIFKSDNQNNYLYSYFNNVVLFIHPILSELIKLSKSNLDLELWIKNIIDKHYFEKIGFITKREINKHFKKFKFLHDNDFFTKVNVDEFISTELNNKIINYQLANIQHIVFELTEDCNLNCDYCAYGKYYDNFGSRERNTLKVSDIFALLDYFTVIWKSSTYNLSFNNWVTISFYGGEPLIEAKNIEKVINKAKLIETKTNINFNFRLTTNGILIHKNLKLLIDNDIKISISIDGDKINNAHRVLQNGKESYDILIKNIKILRDEYPKYYANNVSFISVLHNKNSYEEIENFGNTVLKKFPSIIELSTNGLKESMKGEFFTKYKNILASYEALKNNKCDQDNITIKNPEIYSMFRFITTHSNYIYSSYFHLLNQGRLQKRLPTGTCIPFERKLFLTSDGKILPCERIGQLQELGRVENNKVHLNTNEISEKLNGYYSTIKDLCSNCYMFNSCDQCLFQTNPETNSKYCSLFTNYSTANSYFKKHLSIFEKNSDVYTKVVQKSRVI